MKSVLVILFLLVNTCLFGQTQKDTSPKKAIFGFGFNFGLESLDKMTAEDIGISSSGYTIIDFRGRLNLLKYVNLDAGFSVSKFKDELPFTQAVIFTSGQLAGLPSTGKSKITSGSFYYSLGVRVPLVSKLHLNGSIGQRRFSASRGIPDCTDCKKTDIDISAGTFARTGLSWLSFEGGDQAKGEFDLLYTHYFDQSFQYTITLGFFVYF